MWGGHVRGQHHVGPHQLQNLDRPQEPVEAHQEEDAGGGSGADALREEAQVPPLRARERAHGERERRVRRAAPIVATVLLFLVVSWCGRFVAGVVGVVK